MDGVSTFLAERNAAPTVRAYAERLLGTVAEHADSIDEAVSGALRNWPMDRLAAIDRNILRLGAAEILYIPDVPPRVSIQEAIFLAERFGSPQSPRFVNGVLDALMRSRGEADGDETEAS
jgi:N utilization substance protein B